jgi:predicted transcriptional regulator
MAEHGKVLHIDASVPNEQAVLILKALGFEVRLRMLQLLGSESLSVNQIAEVLGIPPSTAALHIKALEDAELIHTELLPASRGQQKLCSRRSDQIIITLPPTEPVPQQAIELTIPIGTYSQCHIEAPCGLATEARVIGMIDDRLSFFEPHRFQAQILWFRQGFVEYHIPYRLPVHAIPTSVQVRMELCSEAELHNPDWPSDITVWLNGVEVGTWTSPGDFGGTRGALTPSWWLDADSQYGYLKRWEVSNLGTFVDGVQVSSVTTGDIHMAAQPLLTLRVGVKADAVHVGGLNLFGRQFGNYPQDILIRIPYELRSTRT